MNLCCWSCMYISTLSWPAMPAIDCLIYVCACAALLQCASTCTCDLVNMLKLPIWPVIVHAPDVKVLPNNFCRIVHFVAYDPFNKLHKEAHLLSLHLSKEVTKAFRFHPTRMEGTRWAHDMQDETACKSSPLSSLEELQQASSVCAT